VNNNWPKLKWHNYRGIHYHHQGQSVNSSRSSSNISKELITGLFEGTEGLSFTGRRGNSLSELLALAPVVCIGVSHGYSEPLAFGGVAGFITGVSLLTASRCCKLTIDWLTLDRLGMLVAIGLAFKVLLTGLGFC